MFREAIAAQTALGKQVEPLLAAGRLVPDDVTIALIRERLGGVDAADGFVLDGFPRNLAQAEALDEMLGEIGRELDAILFFDLPDDVATERLLKRGSEENRLDDTPEVITERLRTYHEQTEPIVEHYRITGRLVPLHADRSIDEVWSEISDSLQVVA
jgi:adenylate kinase